MNCLSAGLSDGRTAARAPVYRCAGLSACAVIRPKLKYSGSCKNICSATFRLRLSLCLCSKSSEMLLPLLLLLHSRVYLFLASGASP